MMISKNQPHPPLDAEKRIMANTATLERTHANRQFSSAGRRLLALFAAATLSSLWSEASSPTHWSLWETYRSRVVHPAAAIKSEDLERARRNIELHEWAQRYVDGLLEQADRHASQTTPEYLECMIERTTPGCTGPCPACRAKGLPWHPNGQWAWLPDEPDRLTCNACKTVFPNEEFPETILVRSTWDPDQEFRFVGGETFKCFGYTHARPSLSGIVRARKLGYATRQLQALAKAYAFTGEPAYAHAARRILLRLADVFPKYLVRAGYGYGEYSDCDPHTAARRISDLPNDELVYPPNTPDRKLYAGYWAASRIGSSGMDGRWVSTVAEAYDLTCNAHDDAGPVYPEAERLRIERDVLLESTCLAACDPAINNKSVGNRAGCAMVGLVVGHPGLVRFGLEGFRSTVDEWFLPDGGTSESPAYAMMTMNGVRDFALMFRDASDPHGYVAPDGTRMDNFNACRDTRYGDCWQGLIWTLQGDLRHSPSADSYRTTTIGSYHAELIAAAYPTLDHRALLLEFSGGGDPKGSSAEVAMLYREPETAMPGALSLSLPDVVFPSLAQGYLRTGETGRDSLLLLNASDWGGHHHEDSLDLYYWKDGRELLSDLGYLWDHPDKSKTKRTFAHNLVMIDGAAQQTTGRGGSFHLFTVTPHVKAMEASSRAYPAADVYRRLCVQVDHGGAGSYVIDIFRVRGGERRQYVFHGPSNEYEVNGLQLRPAERPLLDDTREAQGDTPWEIRWQLDDGYAFTALAPGASGETVAIGNGWGQRDHRNTDRGAVLPYIVRETRGSDLDAFVTLFYGHDAAEHPALVKAVRLIESPENLAEGTVCVEVTTALGTDVILSTLEPRPLTVRTPIGILASDGRLAVVCSRGDRIVAACLMGGTRLSAGDLQLELPSGSLVGEIVDHGSGGGDSWFVVDALIPEDAEGQTLFVQDGDMRRAYPIRALAAQGDRTRVYTKKDNVGFEARGGNTWEFVATAPGSGLD